MELAHHPSRHPIGRVRNAAHPRSTGPAHPLRGQPPLHRAARGNSVTAPGHATVSEIERYGRTVNVDEIASLAVVLRVPPNRFLDPFAFEPGRSDWLSDVDFAARPALIESR